MNTNYSSQFDFSIPTTRERFLELLNAAQAVKAYRFCRQASLIWLASYPGDLAVNLHLAKAFSGDGKINQALSLVQRICLVDPEFLEAQQELNVLLHATESPDIPVDTSSEKKEGVSYDWKKQIATSKQAYLAGDYESAEQTIHKALTTNPDSPLPAIQHIRIAQAKDDQQTVENLAQVYHARWPECLQFSLYLANAYIQNGNETAGVSLLHQSAAKDTAGQVANRIWGSQFPYKPLWPTSMTIKFDLPIPASLAAYMGWNQLKAGEKITGNSSENIPVLKHRQNEVITTTQQNPNKKKGSVKYTDDVINKIHQEFEQIARKIKKPGFGRSDGRYPMYIIYSTHKGMVNQYGPQTTEVLITHMNELAIEIRKHQGWGAAVILADDPQSTSGFGIQSVSTIDPWKLKINLVDLDRALAKKGCMIGALLIVGGPKIIPFHNLPNPTFDADIDVPSDNPYATLDDNYYVPEWPVGRLPGGSDNDAGLILEQLRRIINFHASENKARSKSMTVILKQVKQNLQTLFTKPERPKFSYAYSAQVWKPSSTMVFKPIGKVSSLFSSPPNQSGALKKKLKLSHLGYFNLHGIKDANDWYGQKNIDSPSRWPEYPVALSPKDLLDHKTPKIIYSEACYGACIDDKAIDQAMSLAFLANGSCAFVGSTVISYGAVKQPLIAADLLGYYFWNLIRQGQPVGTALLKAKFALAREMSKRQGFLDGEDQKTLLSFVLFGDPLATLKEIKTLPVAVIRSVVHPSVKTYSDQAEDTVSGEAIPDEVLLQVKQIVNRYLPELHEADININQQKCKCTFTNLQCSNCKYKTRTTLNNSGRTVLTLSKHIQAADKIHNHYARFTLDINGKVLKLSASR